MGKDGTEGSVAIRQAGGITFGESKDTCTIYGMPLAAKIAGGIDAEYPIGKIGEALVKSLEKRGLRAYGS
jgi:two-component system chemotaxis response regulator CheB